MSEQISWLIEAQDPSNPGCVLPDSFLGISGKTRTFEPNGMLQWMCSSYDAIRFSRKQDAEMFINFWMLHSENLPHSKTMKGFRVGDVRPIATEHSWDMTPAKKE